jgi:hypothetical protein
VIYFAQAPTGGPIKIGQTIRLSLRLAQLLAEHGSLVVLAVLDGSFPEENALHRRFSSLRQQGEWFRPDEDLLDFIRQNGRPWDGKDEAPDDRAVKIARELWVMMNFIIDSGSTEHETVAEYLSSIARATIERDYEKAQRHFKPKKGGSE